MRASKRPLLKCIYVLTAALLLLLDGTARELAESGNIEWTATSFTTSALISLVVGGCVFSICHRLLTDLPKLICRMLPRKEATAAAERRTNRGWVVFVICFCFFVLAWLPYFLAFYPGLCCYDTPIQLEQIRDALYTDHHPIVHTLLIRLCLSVGNSLFGSGNAGIATYVVIQIVILAAALAYGIYAIWKVADASQASLAKKCVICGIVAAILGLLPTSGYLAVSVTKDIIFAAAFLVMSTSVLLLLLKERIPIAEGDAHFTLRTGLLLGISASACANFRNNGKYVILFTIFFTLLFFGIVKKRIYKTLTAVLVIGLMAGLALSSLSFRLVGAASGDRREMLSVPIQQLARVMCYHGDPEVTSEGDGTLSDKEWELLTAFICDDAYLEYEPSIADPVKKHVDTSVALSRAGEFASTYIRLFLRYPGDYYNAFVSLTAGFVSPTDRTHASVYDYRSEDGLDYIATNRTDNASSLQYFGITQAPVSEALYTKMLEWARSDAYLHIPVVKQLIMPGAYLWVFLFFMLFLAEKKEYGSLLAFLPATGYFATMLLGPTVQLRYMFPVMIVLPVLIAISLIGTFKNKTAE